jgi:hypothetical protein
MAIAVWVCSWLLYSIPLFWSIFVPASCCFVTVTPQYNLKSGVWYHCSHCSGLLCLFRIFCAFIWILGLFFLVLWRMPLKFWWRLHWISRSLLVTWSFSLLKSYGGVVLPCFFHLFCYMLWFAYLLGWISILVLYRDLPSEQPSLKGPISSTTQRRENKL